MYLPYLLRNKCSLEDIRSLFLINISSFLLTILSNIAEGQLITFQLYKVSTVQVLKVHLS